MLRIVKVNSLQIITTLNSVILSVTSVFATAFVFTIQLNVWNTLFKLVRSMQLTSNSSGRPKSTPVGYFCYLCGFTLITVFRHVETCVSAVCFHAGILKTQIFTFRRV